MNEAQQSLHDYLSWLEKSWGEHPGFGQGLKKVGLPTATREGLVLKYGTMFESQPLTPDEEALVAEAKARVQPRLGECFRVANMVADNNDFEYVEGFAHGIIAVHHAWNTLNGKVVDLTWRSDKKGHHTNRGSVFTRGLIPSDSAYMGIAIPRDLRWKALLRTTRYQGMLSDIEDIQAVGKMVHGDILSMSGGAG